jgi:hypothetical protein
VDWRDKEIIVNSFDAPIIRGAHPDLTIMDETHNWNQKLIQEYVEKLDAQVADWLKVYSSTGSRGPAVNEKKQGSKITVDFNRRLTASEKFDLRTALLVPEITKVVIHTQEFEDVRFPIRYADTHYTSVTVTAPGFNNPVVLLMEIADVVENNFLNVHPRSVYTHYPRIDGRSD